MVLAYHGTTEKVADGIIAHKHGFSESRNDYDWLGPGVYFWENAYSRAYDWAGYVCGAGKDKPAVIGALISLHGCLDLNDVFSHGRLKIAHQFYMAKTEPDKRKKNSGRHHRLDCAVIETLHDIEKASTPPVSYKSVRASFIEGDPTYPESSFSDKTHVQICVRDLSAVICYFKPFPQ